MIRMFKRRRPVPPAPATSRDDKPIYLAWGLNPIQWAALNDWQRAECRRTVTAAPYFGRAA